MTRWRLTVEWNGAPFMGWQRQAHGPSVQQSLEDALARGAASKAIDGPLSGRRAVVTAGPTREPIDPVRYIANRSSGRQGHAIAAALAAAGRAAGVRHAADCHAVSSWPFRRR